MTIELALLLASTLAWIVAEAAVSAREPHAHLPRELATGFALLAAHVTGVIEHVARDTTGALAGGLLIAAGIALRVAAIRALGSSFVSTSARPARVISTGLYRVMKHPSEIGLIAAAAGAAVLLGSVLAAAVVALAVVPLGIARCAEEDRVLAG